MRFLAAALLLICVPAEGPALAAAEGPAPAGPRRVKSLIGSNVRSDRWTMRRRPHQIEELSGNVVYEQGAHLLRADRARFDHSSLELQASGDVRGRETFPDGNTLFVRGGRAVHNGRTKRGRLRGRGDRIAFSVSGPDGGRLGEGGARELRWDAAERTATLEGDVRFASESGEGRAESARYDRDADSLELGGRRPIVTARRPDWTAALQADRITAFRLTARRRPPRYGDVGRRGAVPGGFGKDVAPPVRRLVTGDGEARGWIRFEKPLDAAEAR